MQLMEPYLEDFTEYIEYDFHYTEGSYSFINNDPVFPKKL